MHVSSSRVGGFYWIAALLLGLLIINLADAEESVDKDSTCSSTNEDGECQWEEVESPSSCTLYLAESSIPGAGLGIFTAIDRIEGDIIGNGDVIIPIVDFDYHMKADYKFNSVYHFDPTSNYVWDGREFNLQYETAFVHTGLAAFAPGLDCAINCHLGLLNVDKSEPRYDTSNLHRSTDPGAGAFTPYHNSSTIVTHFIPAGGELFKSYGDEYFLSRKKLELVPVWEDYPQAEEFVGLFNKMWDDHLAHLPPQLVADLWELVQGFPLRSRLFNALPRNMDEFEQVILDGVRAILQPAYTRDMPYLQEHGRCVDHIKSDTSTLRQAGRGAFAIRGLEKGEIVTGSPLIWYPNGDYFKMYQGNWTSQQDPPDIQNQIHSQILMNYCWTHPESSLFICPYGPGVQYINHNKTLANVKVKWAEHGQMGHNSEILQKHPENMFPIANPGLTLDFVATHDIAPGEELFMDYGDAWEKAWERHTAEWNAKASLSLNYQSARDWSMENPNAVLRTVDEQIDDPYPEHFTFRCLKEIGAYELTSEEAIGLWDVRTVGLPCSIQQRKEEDGEHRYIVHFLPDADYEHGLEELELGPDENGQLWWLETDWIVREAIKVVDAPYTTDLHLSHAFRHPIGFPDDLFPQAWRGYRTAGIW